MRALPWLLLVSWLWGCQSARPDEAAPRPTPPPTALTDSELGACQSQIAGVLAEAGQPGAPAFDAHRVAILGRARGEPLVFLREPRATTLDSLPPAAIGTQKAFAHLSAHRRVRAWRTRHRGEPAVLRALVLREGYLYSSDPMEAMALVNLLALDDLFDQPEIHLQRGAGVQQLKRDREGSYRYASGEHAGREAKLLFGDRVAVQRAALARPLHLDLRALSDQEGFDRAKVVHLTKTHVVAELRFGDVWVRALLAAQGARLGVRCLDAPLRARAAIRAWQRAELPRRGAHMRLRQAITEQLDEALPFDRPRGEKSIDKDGQLRVQWRWAYRTGHHAFRFEDESYPVFDSRGRPHPPQVCVDFVLDSFERASGSWYRGRDDQARGRVVGGLDFDAWGIGNRRGVIAFGEFAETRPELFLVRRFRPEERVPFRERDRFFEFLQKQAPLVRAGDVVAIRGRKSDGLVHQHALFVEATDPITGFPHALADQMKRPRRRTWEAIMAEAPARSLYYRVRPTAHLLGLVAGGAQLRNDAEGGGQTGAPR